MSFIVRFTDDTGHAPSADWIVLSCKPKVSAALVNMDLRRLRQQGRVTMFKVIDNEWPAGHVYYYGATAAAARAVLEAMK